MKFRTVRPHAIDYYVLPDSRALIASRECGHRVYFPTGRCRCLPWHFHRSTCSLRPSLNTAGPVGGCLRCDPMRCIRAEKSLAAGVIRSAERITLYGVSQFTRRDARVAREVCVPRGALRANAALALILIRASRRGSIGFDYQIRCLIINSERWLGDAGSRNVAHMLTKNLYGWRASEASPSYWKPRAIPMIFRILIGGSKTRHGFFLKRSRRLWIFAWRGSGARKEFATLPSSPWQRH